VPEKAVTYTVLFDAVTVNNRMVQAADLILSILLLFIKPIQKNTGSSTKYELPVFSSSINTERHLFLCVYYSL